jgi:trehalose 6-phosphate phosphatase
MRPPWPSRPALFLDVDGTLLELAEHPDRVVPSARLQALLPALPAATGEAVALISGRRIADLDRVLAPHLFTAAGVHGLERRVDGGPIVTHGAVEALDPARLAAEDFVVRHPGVWIEDKRLTLAIHYRARPELEPQMSEFGAALQRSLGPEYEVLQGHTVTEIKSRAADKGEAIRAFMAERPFCGRTPIFIGDDVTDEAGFSVVNEQEGVSVKVGPGETLARWRLDGVEAVIEWLEAAIGLMQTRSLA